MYKLLIVLFLNFATMFFSQNLQEFRALMQKGETSEKEAKNLIEKSKTAQEKYKKPIFSGFLAVGNFFMAKHAFNPIKKMSYFKTGKNILDNAIKTDPNNLELKLMRLITQEKTPKMLGYNKQIEEDRLFLKREYQNTNDIDLKNFIKSYLKL